MERASMSIVTVEGLTAALWVILAGSGVYVGSSKTVILADYYKSLVVA